MKYRNKPSGHKQGIFTSIYSILYRLIHQSPPSPPSYDWIMHSFKIIIFRSFMYTNWIWHILNYLVFFMYNISGVSCGDSNFLFSNENHLFSHELLREFHPVIFCLCLTHKRQRILDLFLPNIPIDIMER